MRCEYQARNIDRLLTYASQGEGHHCPAELKRHLESCPECARLISEQQAVWRSLDTWEAPAVSPHFETALWSRLEEPQSLRESWRERLQNWMMWQSRPALPIVAACATVLLAATLSVPWLMMSHSPIRLDQVDIEQVEKTVDDMDLLRTLTPVAGVTTAKRDASL